MQGGVIKKFMKQQHINFKTSKMKDKEMIIKVELPTTSDLFKKHFNDMGQTGLLHPNTESFFEELNMVCQIKDAINKINNNEQRKIH